ncbi:hypothetical protein R3P38DRAFT_3189518 [Favolaschia claudopus]|uniref:Uncharacterized protein n=1 Tax=Favolaschia claudopus TaxID=2862362 RepID=A0AAW0BSU5_9AGAR
MYDFSSLSSPPVSPGTPAAIALRLPAIIIFKLFKVPQVVLLRHIAVPRAVIGVYTPSVCVSPSRQAILANSMSGQRLFTPLSPPQLSAHGIDFSSGPPYLAPTPSHLKPFSQASARVPPSPSSLRMAQRLFHRPQQQSMHLWRSHYSPLASRTPPRSTAHAVMRRTLYGARYPCRRRHLLITVATGVVQHIQEIFRRLPNVRPPCPSTGFASTFLDADT